MVGRAGQPDRVLPGSGVRYGREVVFVSEPLAEVEAALPDLRRLYLILLQSALHRHGMEFYDRAFIRPSRVIGRVLSRDEANAEEAKGNYVVSVDGGYRRIVAAPVPRETGSSSASSGRATIRTAETPPETGR